METIKIFRLLRTNKRAQQRQQNRLLLIMVCLLFACYSFQSTAACPTDYCTCKWRGGKQTVECGNRLLPVIPENMDPGTQVLNFSGNSLQVLQSERFLRLDLLNLQKIYLAHNQLIRIHENTFRGLSNLVELDLSENLLQHVPSETFQDYSSLMRLSLSGNPIREVKASAFRYLSFLTTLELSNCQIERVENEAFVGMDNLEWLRLDGNRISFIQGTHILPKSLHGISLQSNRWSCDCRLLDLHEWLNSNKIPQTEEPKCVDPPRLKGQVIKTLKRDELACLPEVNLTSTHTEISEGRNVSIVCIVRAIPEPKILWLFNGQVMTNDSFGDNLRMSYYIDETGNAEEKRSEIFIYNVSAGDNGTFSCVGQNVAGTIFSNYSLRVIIKEPPVVNEVSFPRDYMNYIIASSTGAGVIFVVLLCTIVVKCKQRQPKKRKKCRSSSAAASVPGNTSSTDGSTNDTGLMKCSSILNDADSLNGSSGMLMAEGMTPTKMCKENGVIIGGQMKQNLLLYAPAHYQQQQQQQSLDACSASAAQALQLNVSLANAHAASGTPPPLMIGTALGTTIAYCSPPSSVRNYQEKNPDLVNDAESVKQKLKSATSLDTDYDAASDCSGPCSIQGLNVPVQYENCYQLTPQFGSQIIRPNMNTNVTAASRFAAMTTLPRGMQLKTVMNNLSTVPQHQVDVHLNPVCFLGQDGFAYDYSNAHLQQQPQSHHHLHLQPQHSLGATPPSQATAQQAQQNFYRTLPHNRAHKQQQFAASAANSGMRYSLEAELLQRSGTPTYDKYMPNVRFTAEGYPQPQPEQLVQYPSPPEGYKSTNSPKIGGNADSSMGGASTISAVAFQQWPPCLPGYHAQPIRYPPTIVGVLSAQPTSTPAIGATQQQQQQQLQQKSNTTVALAVTSQTQTQPCVSNSSGSSITGSTTGTPGTIMDMKKRCVSSQADASTIPECDENDVSPTTSNAGLTDAAAAAAKTSTTTTTTTTTAAAAALVGTDSAALTEEKSKLRHLNGPLADSPDEGYVGDSHEGADI
ncbi:uncharacterized protein LOC119687040 [Teleopsis dalmanni]|uniref:uncharacterized protein LOC119687040 n=1 Tax=Teleopsis dalmanni TaxID=139649 RepID=UPI0018CC97E6|nr:uncharacterized protein LOC119687040 [Teleopsis dalmanni]